jgi:hypothetical protein
MSPKTKDSTGPLSALSHNSVVPLSHKRRQREYISQKLKIKENCSYQEPRRRYLIQEIIEGVEKSHHTTPFNENNTVVQIIKG